MRWALVLFLLPFVFGAVNISNSFDWRFAYLLGYYSAIGGDMYFALDSEATAKEVFPYLPSLNEKANELFVIFSDSNPVMENYDQYLRGMGFVNVEVRSFQDYAQLNRILFEEYGPFECYVIVADGGGEWAYAGASYAAHRRCALFIANTDTIDIIQELVPPDSDITIIGYAGKRLREIYPNALYINTGNKAEDTVEVAKLYAPNPSTIYLVSGMYLYLPGHYKDKPVWVSGSQGIPLLAAYPEGIPDPVMEFIEESDVKVVAFFGAELDKTFGDVRDEFIEKGIKPLVFTHLAFRNVPTRDPNERYPPFVLFMPGGDVFINIERVNALAEGKILFTFRNRGDGIGYLLPVLVNIKCGGEDIPISIPQEPFVILPQGVFVWEVSTQPLPMTGCEVKFEGRYGPDKDRLLFSIQGELGFMPEKIEDPSNIEVTRVVYSPRLKAFVIYVNNLSEVRVYVYPTVKNVLVDGIPTDFSGRTFTLEPNSSGKVYVKAELSDADIIDNPTVRVYLRYGKRADLPIKILEGDYPLEKETLTDVVLEFVEENFLLVTAIVVLILVILLILRRR